MRISRLIAFAAPLALLMSAPVVQAQRFGNPEVLAPDFPTPEVVIQRMLQLAHLKPGETLYDLGSGEGRIVIAAAREFKARAVGIELSPELCRLSTLHIKALGLDDRVKIVHANLLKVDLSPADVVTIYLLTASNDLLRPNLERDLKTGARVVSHDYQIRGWKPVAEEKISAEGRSRTIYVYEIGPKK